MWVADADQFVRRTDCKKYGKDQWASLFAHLKPEGPSITQEAFKQNRIRKLKSLIYLPCATSSLTGRRGRATTSGARQVSMPAPGDVGPFLEHMAYLFPDEVDRGHVLDYLALLIQRPAEKIHFALLIRGAQGTGKSCGSGALAEALVGQEHRRATQALDEIDRLADNAVHANSAFERGRKSGAIDPDRSGALKPIGTGSLTNPQPTDAYVSRCPKRKNRFR